MYNVHLWLDTIYIIFFFNSTFAAELSKTNENQLERFCITPKCVSAAARILENLDTSVDPCDDFYQFACGGFTKNRPLYKTESYVDGFSLVQDLVQNELKTAFEQSSNPTQPKSFSLLRQFYNTCMDVNAIESKGLTTINEILKYIGGWPVVEEQSWNKHEFDWMTLMYKFRKLGFPVNQLLNVEVSTDAKNSSHPVITLDQAHLGLDRIYLIQGLNNNVVRSYLEYMVEVSVIMGASRSLSDNQMQDSLNFEIELAKISAAPEDLLNASLLYNPLTTKQLENIYRTIPWSTYLTNIFQLKEFKLSIDDTVVISRPQYINDLEKLLERTPKRVLANYLVWRAMEFSIPYLTQNLNDEKFKFDKVVSGVESKQERWKSCLQDLRDSLEVAVGALYTRKYFNKSSKNYVTEIITNVRDAFAKLIKDVDWMDHKTRNKALEKLRSIIPLVGYPDEVFDDIKLDAYYSDLTLYSGDYLQSKLNISIFKRNINFGTLNQSINKTEWTTWISLASVNAVYSPATNTIQVPAGILQDIIFGEDKPHYLNFGSIGFISGHEMTHGFDNYGRQYDKDGNVIDWWTEGTSAAFVKRTQCFIEQYGNITVPEIGLKLNGLNTLGENIADNGGIKEAYLAYQAWVEVNGLEPKLPGIELSPNQLFWISAATPFCLRPTVEFLKQEILTDGHSIDRYRILVPFSNTEYFAQDYNCPLGAKMNPKRKCTVW